MGRGLLFQCQLPWRGRLSRQRSKPSTTYAVLAILSDSYPPLKGRLPTCYSPVRHFTRGRSPFLVRLACVRPAANVRSEPGSNSPVNFPNLKSNLFVAFAARTLLPHPIGLRPSGSETRFPSSLRDSVFKDRLRFVRRGPVAYSVAPRCQHFFFCATPESSRPGTVKIATSSGDARKK
jgi:hypothetical protein